MFERFTDSARQVVVEAQLEARRLRHDCIGTEHLLLGLMASPGTRVARYLRDHGVDREAVLEVLPRGGPGQLDPDALATLGIDLDEVRRRVEDAFGPGALAPQGWCRRPGRRTGRPFMPRSKKVLELALREALARGDRHVGAEHVLFGLVREGEGLAARVLERRGVTLADAHAALGDDQRMAG